MPPSMLNELFGKEYQLGYQEMLRIGVAFMGSVRDKNFVERKAGDRLFRLYARHKLKQDEKAVRQEFSTLGVVALYLQALEVANNEMKDNKSFNEKGILEPKVPELIKLPEDIDFQAIELLKLSFLANSLHLENSGPLIMFGTMTAEALLQKKYQAKTPEKLVRSIGIAKRLAEMKMKELEKDSIEKGNVWYRLKLFLEVVSATFPSMHAQLFPNYLLFNLPTEDEDTRPYQMTIIVDEPDNGDTSSTVPLLLEYLKDDSDSEDTQPSQATQPLLPTTTGV